MQIKSPFVIPGWIQYFPKAVSDAFAISERQTKMTANSLIRIFFNHVFFSLLQNKSRLKNVGIIPRIEQ